MIYLNNNMNYRKNIMKSAACALAVLLVMAGFPACKKDDTAPLPPVVVSDLAITKPAGGWVISRYQPLRLGITTTLQKPTYVWLVDEVVVSSDSVFYFISNTAGKHSVVLIAKEGNTVRLDSASIQVNKEATTYSKSIAKVFEYFPAPGQFVNGLPAYTDGATAADMAAAAEVELKANRMISLGSFGGYVVMGFDHTVLNVPNKKSFRVGGNALGGALNSPWSEPGVVEVSLDANGNGLPDDEWYEIAGSDYNNPGTVKNYEITYYQPDPNKVPTPDESAPYVSDTTYIRWTDNQGGTGHVFQNVFNTGNYYPQWKGAAISFKGTKLTNEGVYDINGDGSYYVSLPFAYGYSDNWPEGDDRTGMKIDWAVDKNGKPVKLAGINFVRVHTAILANAGWLGEVSTEVTGIEDLNLN